MTQPPPTPGRGDVWLDILRDVAPPWIHPVRAPDGTMDFHVPRAASIPDGRIRTLRFRLMVDMAARRDLGIARYGTPLQYDNGRDPTRDAYEEALDLLAYLTQGHMPRWMRWLALLLIVALRRRLT